MHPARKLTAPDGEQVEEYVSGGPLMTNGATETVVHLVSSQGEHVGQLVHWARPDGKRELNRCSMPGWWEPSPELGLLLNKRADGRWEAR